MRSVIRFLAIGFVLGFVGVGSAVAQNTGQISGTVHDPSGAVVAGANIKAQNPATSFTRETTSSTNGTYRMDQLPVGTYSITVEATGFKTSVLNKIALSVNDALTIDINLEVGQVSEIVTVSEGAAELVNTTTSVMGKTVDNRTLNDLPILSGAGGRNPLALAPLQAGVIPAGQVGPFSVNGQRAQSNNFLLDGGDSNDLAINVPDAVQGFSPDALQEFRILTNTYSADMGRNSGAVVTLISKSGTNQFHGNLFEFFRNRVLNATPFFNNSAPTFVGLRKPQFNTNEFGGTIGGPLYLPRFGEGGKSWYDGEDRTFFFFSYLGFRRRQGVTSTATVPNDAERAIINAVGTPEARALLAQVPRASSGRTLFASAGNSLDRDQVSIRGDHRFSSKNNFFITFFNEDQTFTDPFAFGGSPMPGFGTSGVLNFRNIVVSDFHMFTPRLINEFRFSWHQRDTLSVVPVNKTTPADLGIQGIVADDPAALGPPRVDISGFSNFGNTIQGPQGRDDNTFQFTDNVTHQRGDHSMKFGGEYRNYFQNQTFDFINSGYYFFTGDMAAIFHGGATIPGLGAALSDFARGEVIEFVQNSAGTPRYETQSYNLYWLDDWKVKKNLTLNIGARYELDMPLVDAQNRVNTFRRGQRSTVFPSAPAGLVFPGDTGITDSTYQTDKNNIAPRVGFAWDIFGDGKLSLRGGYGMFYDTVISETTLQFLTAAPFAIQPFTDCTTVDNPFSNPHPACGFSPIPQPFPHEPARPGDPFNFVDIAPIGLTINDPAFETPYSHQYNLNVQWEFMKNYLLEVAYVGTGGRHMLTRYEGNPAVLTPTASSANTTARRVMNIGHPDSAAYGGQVFSNITIQATTATSSYNSLQATVSHRFSDGFQFQNAFTWGHCIDTSSGLRSNQRYNDFQADRGNCDQDIRLRNVFSGIYELPFMKDQKGALGKLLGGWQLSGVLATQTGTPFNITDSSDRSLQGAGGNRPDRTSTSLEFLDPRNTDLANGGQNRMFNGTGGGTATAATNPYFRRVGSGTSIALGAGRFGSMGRNVFHGPGDFILDMTLMKRTKIGEDKILEFRVEAFNVLNHANFGNPNGAIDSANFGRITTTRDPRLIQFGLKFHF
jgi:hypothetical protein